MDENEVKKPAYPHVHMAKMLKILAAPVANFNRLGGVNLG